MAGVINTGSNPKALWPGIEAFWGTWYEEHPEEYMQLFDKEISTKAYEESVGLIGFGLAPVKAEGASVQYDSQTQGLTQRFTNDTYGLGYIVTEEEQQDNQYLDSIMFKRTRMLAHSMSTTKETVGANVYNRAFNTSYAYESGVSLISASHVQGNGNQSNILAVSADLSEASLEDMCIQIDNAVDPRGLKMKIRAMDLIIPTALRFDAARILKSTLQSGTANNDINALAQQGSIQGTVVNHYLTDSDAWFVRTNAPEGMKYFERQEDRLSEDNDFDTTNFKVKQTARYVFGASDFRGIYGSAGA